MSKIVYLGIDETSLGIGNNSSIVVATQTSNPELTKDKGILKLKKAKDIIREAITKNLPPQFPSLDEMRATGLDNYHWTRAKGGRFSLKELQHATIAHVIQVNGYKPESTVIYLDAFYANYPKSQYLIHEYLDRRGFKIPINHINICGSGDKCVPIINYADLLAFQIGLNLNERYREHNPDNKEFPFDPTEIPFDEQRIMIPLAEKGRQLREEILKDW
jgi:hypothetical protein